MANLTKRDIVVKISNDTGLVQHQVFEVVQRTLDVITDSLARGEDVELRNFGIFEVRLTKERVGRNPNQPGSSFKIPPRATVKFKAGKVMRQKVSKLSSALKQAEARRARRSNCVVPFRDCRAGSTAFRASWATAVGLTFTLIRQRIGSCTRVFSEKKGPARPIKRWRS